jgi:hypothetical protein
MYSYEPTVPDMMDEFENQGLTEITTRNRRRRGSMVFFDRIASNSGPRVEYIFNVRSGLSYRKVGECPAYPINLRDTDTREYEREFNRARAMRKSFRYIDSFRNRR